MSEAREPCKFCGRPTDADGICTQYEDARRLQQQKTDRTTKYNTKAR